MTSYKTGLVALALTACLGLGCVAGGGSSDSPNGGGTDPANGGAFPTEENDATASDDQNSWLPTISCITGEERRSEQWSGGAPTVTIVTSMGQFKIALFTTAAPVTTANFLKYVDEGFYDGDDGLGATTFHRVIKDFMIQGGGIAANGAYKITHEAIPIESDNGLCNLRGSVAMARTNNPNSATSQFFINHVDNESLNFVDAQTPGYTVFGHVIEGMDVVDSIAVSQTNAADIPLNPILITDVYQ